MKASEQPGGKPTVVTIRTVADKAGVSIGTVSRVLNNKGGVGLETRQRTLAVAQELGYRLPRRTSTPASDVIHFGLLNCLFPDDLISNPFYHDVFTGVDLACRENNISLSFSNLDISTDFLESSPPLLKLGDLSGLILVGPMPGSIVSALAMQTALPLVLIDNVLPTLEFDTVLIDNQAGIKLALDHLVALGHRHISFLGGPDHPSIAERRQAYLLGLQQHHLTPFIASGGDMEVEAGATGAGEIMRQRPETTAIICANDLRAIGAIRQLQQLGYQTPADCSVIGFDDVGPAQITSPPITTIQVDRLALGEIATQLLLARLKTPDRPAMTTRVGVRLVERDSVAPPRLESKPHLSVPNA